MALLNAPFDERVLRLQIEDIEFVDPGRDDEQRTAMDRGRRRRVLNELHQLILKNHLSRRVRDVFAEREGGKVGHLRREPAAAALEIPDQISEAIDQIFATALDRHIEHRRVGHCEIGRRQRADHLAGIKLRLAVSMRIEALDAADRRLNIARHQQIGLLHVVKDGVLAPRFVLESLVLLGRRNNRVAGRLGKDLAGGSLPQPRQIGRKLGLVLDDLGRIEGGWMNS